MNEYQEMKEDLERLGFDIYVGCRVSAWEYANEIGISTPEIVAKFSDCDVLRAIYRSAQVMGMFMGMLCFDEEEEFVECEVCNEEVEADELMECNLCGALFCDDCGCFPEDERFCSTGCAGNEGWTRNCAGDWVYTKPGRLRRRRLLQ